MLHKNFYIVLTPPEFFFFIFNTHVDIYSFLITRCEDFPFVKFSPLKMINTPNFSDLIKQSRPKIFLGNIQEKQSLTIFI